MKRKRSKKGKKLKQVDVDPVKKTSELLSLVPNGFSIPLFCTDFMAQYSEIISKLRQSAENLSDNRFYQQMMNMVEKMAALVEKGEYQAAVNCVKKAPYGSSFDNPKIYSQVIWAILAPLEQTFNVKFCFAKTEELLFYMRITNRTSSARLQWLMWISDNNNPQLVVFPWNSRKFRIFFANYLPGLRQKLEVIGFPIALIFLVGQYLLIKSVLC